MTCLSRDIAVYSYSLQSRAPLAPYRLAPYFLATSRSCCLAVAAGINFRSERFGFLPARLPTCTTFARDSTLTPPTTRRLSITTTSHPHQLSIATPRTHRNSRQKTQSRTGVEKCPGPLFTNPHLIQSKAKCNFDCSEEVLSGIKGSLVERNEMGSIAKETSSASSFLSDQQQSPYSLGSDCIDNQSAVTPEGMGQEGSTSIESIAGAEPLASTPRPFDDDDCVLVLEHTTSSQPTEDQGSPNVGIIRVSLGISAEINMDGIGIGEDGNAKMTVAEGSEYDCTGYLDRALPGIPTTPSIYEECTESNNYGQDGTLSLHLSETPTDTTSSSYHSVTFPSTDYFSPSPSNPSSCSDSTTPTSTRPRLRLASLSPSTSTQVTDKPLSDSPPLPFQQSTSSPWQLSSSTSSRDHSASSSQSSLLDPGGITRFEVADVEARPNGVVHFSEGRADDKRYHALLELVETEAGYLQSLRILVKVSTSEKTSSEIGSRTVLITCSFLTFRCVGISSGLFCFTTNHHIAIFQEHCCRRTKFGSPSRIARTHRSKVRFYKCRSMLEGSQGWYS